MKTTDWQLQVEVEILNLQGVNDFFWQVQGGHGSGVPIEGSIKKIVTLNVGITEAKGVILLGSGLGACAILDEFTRRLTPENRKLKISINQVSEIDYKSFKEILAKSDFNPSVKYASSSLTVTFSDDQIATYSRFASVLCDFITDKG